MSEFSMQSSVLGSKQSELNDIAGKLSNYSDEISSLHAMIRHKTLSRSGLDKTLRAAAANAGTCSMKSRAMGDKLEYAVNMYTKVENELCDKKGNTPEKPSLIEWAKKLPFNLHFLNIIVGPGGALNFPTIYQIIKSVIDYLDRGRKSDYPFPMSLIMSATTLFAASLLEMSGIAMKGSGPSLDAPEHFLSFGSKDGDIGIKAGIGIGGSLLSGEIGTSYGLLSSKAEGEVLTGAVKAEGKCVLFEDGEFKPQLGVEAEAEASLLKGEISSQYGSEQFNVHGSMEGSVGNASAGVSAGVDLKTGQIGAKAEVGASVFKGEVKGGFTLFGVKIDFSGEGEAIGVGAKAEFGVDKESLTIGGKLCAGLGLGLKIKISW